MENLQNNLVSSKKSQGEKNDRREICRLRDISNKINRQKRVPYLEPYSNGQI
jgi:hypothetical protein